MEDFMAGSLKKAKEKPEEDIRANVGGTAGKRGLAVFAIVERR
jgi:hypothetical protein